MNYNRMLDKFMQEKANLLNKDFKILKTKYYNNKDKRIIRNLIPIIAELIWNKLEDNVFLEKAFNLSFETCPFCILMAEVLNLGTICFNCEYAKNHRICMDVSSDFRKIMDKKINELETIENVCCNIFTNNYFKKLIKKIKKEEKELIKKEKKRKVKNKE